jgi:hypothetical protein
MGQLVPLHLGGAHPAPVEVMLPSSCDTLQAAHERVSEAVLKSRQAHTPVLAIYAGDGSPITHLDQVSDGDVLMVRIASQQYRVCVHACVWFWVTRVVENYPLLTFCCCACA